MPQVGNAGFSVTCSNAPPNGPGVIGLSAGSLASPFVILGLEIWIAPFSVLLLPVGSNAVGAAEVSLPIPPDPSLAGGQANLQFVFPSPCGPQGLSASNALTVIVQP